MGWFFARTKVSKSKAEAREPVPFELLCACGNLVAGMREKSAQKIPCTSCSKTVFVLPLSPYPNVAVEITKPKKSEGKSADQEKDESTVSAIPPRTPVADSLSVEVPGAVEVKPGDRVRRWMSPTWIASIVILLALGVTAGVVVHRQRLDQARLTVQKDGEAGIQALRDHQFGEARDALQRAVEALDILGKKEDEFSQLIRQSHREAWAASELLPGTIYDYLGGEPLPSSRWLIFDLSVVKMANGIVDLDFPFSAGVDGGKPIRLYLSGMSWIREIEDQLDPEQPVRMIFAAQIKSIERSENSISVTLDESTSFLWSSYSSLSSLGLAGTEKEQLAMQETLRVQNELRKPKEKP